MNNNDTHELLTRDILLMILISVAAAIPNNRAREIVTDGIERLAQRCEALTKEDEDNEEQLDKDADVAEAQVEHLFDNT